nr:MAG TPA: hypothetical protein [Caudoviricetes sp.]
MLFVRPFANTFARTRERSIFSNKTGGRFYPPCLAKIRLIFQIGFSKLSK